MTGPSSQDVVIPDAFTRRGGELCAEDVPLARIVKAVGSPVFVYSATALERGFDALDAAFGETPHSLCYAIKSTPRTRTCSSALASA